MFITRRQLEEEKAKAVSEAQDRIWLCERIDKLERKRTRKKLGIKNIKVNPIWVYFI